MDDTFHMFTNLFVQRQEKENEFKLPQQVL